MWQCNKDVEGQRRFLTDDEDGKSNFRELCGVLGLDFDFFAIENDELLVSNLDVLVLKTVNLPLVLREERRRHHLCGSIGLIPKVRT